MSSDSASSEKPDSPEAAPASLDYVPILEEPEQAPLSPDYVLGPEYPKYLALSDEEEDHADYPDNGGDDDDEPSDDDNDDDTGDEDEGPFEDEEDDKEEEEHLAPADSSAVPVIDPVSSAGILPYDEEVPVEDQPYAIADSPIALSPGYVTGYVADSDPEEDHADYPDNGGDDDDEPSDDDNDDDTGDEDEGPFEDEEDDKEEEEHLAPADSSAVPVIDPVSSAEDTKAFETDEAAPTLVPSPKRHTARMSVRPQAPVPLPSKVEVERLLALPIPPPSPLTLLSSPLPQIPSPPLPPPPSSLHLPPPLPASLFIPPVDCREDTSKADLPPHKRLCLTALTLRYEVGESSMADPRPTGGHGADYGCIDTVDAEVRRQRVEEVGYGIKDVWVDPAETVEEVAPTTLEEVNNKRVDILAEDRQFHYETTRLLDQEALVSQEAWAHSIGLSTIVHYELQAYRTHTQMQDYRIASQELLTATLIAHVWALQGQLVSSIRTDSGTSG
ncbi:hypothetical protein Tco_0798124 [Tanacetum coccineum]